MKAEIPPALRELMKLSIEQAKRGCRDLRHDQREGLEVARRRLAGRPRQTVALNAKIAEITRMNAEANFAFAMRLAELRDVTQALEMQNEHVKKQMETFVRQLEEMRDLTAAIVQDANPARDVSKPGAARSAGSSSSYAPSSSFTPGETGRTY